MKPIIGIVECYKFENYKYAIEKHGGVVKQLLIGSEPSISDVNGLLLPGGGDIDPENYGENEHPMTQFVNRSRDEFEISLFNEAIRRDKSVLGICRGLQIFCCAMDGSLYQHIPEYLPPLFPDFPIHKEDGVDTEHDIKITVGSRLSQSIGESSARVNSSHHQAVKVVGDELLVTAQSKDGIIEAMEFPEKQFVIAVQYHPERMWSNPDATLTEREFLNHATKLFRSFIKSATKRRLSC